MSNNMRERYVYAATKHLPKKTREDVEAELQTLIDDLLEERLGEAAPTEADVNAVLEALGNPYELGQQYSPDAGQTLIGPPYLAPFKLILKIVLPIVAAGILLAQLLAFFTAAQPDYVSLFTGLLAEVFNGVLEAFAIVTILFAIFQRVGADVITAPVALKDLPEVPQGKQRISTADCVAGIIFTAVFMAVFLAAPGIFGLIWLDMGTAYIPVFNVAFITSRWWCVVLIGCAGIAQEAYALYEGRYTGRLAMFTAATSVVQIIAGILLIKPATSINPLGMQALDALTGHNVSWLFNASAFSDILFFLLVLSCVVEVGTTAYRARKYN